MEINDYYDILGITENASAEEIKSAYRKQALKYHPDMVSDDFKERAGELFREIAEAYYVLSNPRRRQEYQLFRQSQRRLRGTGNGIPDLFSNPGFNRDHIRNYANSAFSNRQGLSYQRILALIIALACGVFLYFIGEKAGVNLWMVLPGALGFISVWYGNAAEEPSGCMITIIGWILLFIEIIIIASAASHLELW